MDNSIIPILKELERIYDILANKFELKQPRPLITVQTKGRQNALGWFAQDRWLNEKKEISEITICAEDLNKDPVETLIHEMVHYSNACEKIDDCNNQQYHNKSFKIKAESYGLNVEKSGRYGWSATSIAEKLAVILNDIKIDYKIFELYRKTNVPVSAPTKMKKWSCGCTTVRCAVQLNARCLICNNDFKEVE